MLALSDNDLAKLKNLKPTIKIDNQKVSYETQALIYQIRKAIFLNLPFYEYFRKYHAITGDDTHIHIMPYTPQEAGTSIKKMAENAKVILAVGRARRTLHGFLNKDAKAPAPDYVQPEKMSLGLVASRIVVEANDLPQATLVADYSGNPLQGSYMGSKGCFASRSINKKLPSNMKRIK